MPPPEKRPEQWTPADWDDRLRKLREAVAALDGYLQWAFLDGDFAYQVGPREWGSATVTPGDDLWYKAAGRLYDVMEMFDRAGSVLNQEPKFYHLLKSHCPHCDSSLP